MKLYYAPGACSLGIHVLLEEIGQPFELQRLNLMEGEQYKPEFTAVNPKSKVPTLVRDDGSVLTEFPAIALWLAHTNPEKRLLPSDPEGMARTLENLDYCVSTLHMHGFSRLFRPANFTPNESDQEAVKTRGREMLAKGFRIVADRLGDKDYVAGNYSIADPALYYVEVWAKNQNIELPPALVAHRERMEQRPAVQRMRKSEGLESNA